jgi:elongation factor Ts
LAVDRDGIDADVIEKEKGIYLEQAKNEGKPENIAEKIVQGRVEKFFQENCLMEQPFVKNPDQTIDQIVTDLTAKIGEKIGVRRFACFRLGDE